MLGVLGDPLMIEYGCGHLDASGQVVSTGQLAYSSAGHGCTPFSVSGLLYTHSWHQLWEQSRAAVFVILWSAVITFLLMHLIKLILRGVRYKDEILEIGDLAIHDEEAFPEEKFAERVGAFAMAGIGEGSPTPPGAGGDGEPSGSPPASPAGTAH